MMLNRDGMVARAYFFAHRLWRSFAGDDYIERPIRTDICTVIRTLFISAPLAVAVNLAVIVFAIYSLWQFVFALWLNIMTVGAVTAVFAFFAALMFVIWVFVYGGDALVKKIASAEFTQLIVEHYEAKKSRICPLVEIRGGTDATA